MVAGSTRSRFLRAAGGTLLAVALGPSTALAGLRRSAAGIALTARNVGRRYAGDRTLFATVSPGVPERDAAAVSFVLSRRATVTLEAVRTRRRLANVAWKTHLPLRPGKHELRWTPAPEIPVGSYVMRLTIDPGKGSKTVLGGRRPATITRQRAPVVRVLGVEATFLRRSYDPGEPMELSIFADAPALTLQFLRCGYETDLSVRNDELLGAPKGDPVPIDWTGKRSKAVTITVQTGAWPSGFYAARLTTDDGRVGFAPFVLRAATPGTRRQLVVLPTNTWQAYNMYDRDGDGWGDTWYAGGDPAVELDRPYRDRGVPPRFKAYDRAFLRWLARTGKSPDFAADDDLEAFASGDELRALYDLVVFPGHSEYMTESAYNVVERFRDLGGRIVFLSANNFFWRIDKSGREDQARPDSGAATAGRKPGSSVCSTARTTTAGDKGRSRSSPRRRPRGCSTRPVSSPARSSASRSAVTESKSTPPPRTLRPERSCSPGSSTCSGPA